MSCEAESGLSEAIGFGNGAFIQERNAVLALLMSGLGRAHKPKDNYREEWTAKNGNQDPRRRVSISSSRHIHRDRDHDYPGEPDAKR